MEKNALLYINVRWKFEPRNWNLSSTSEPVYFILTEINKQNLHEVIATIKFQRGQLTQYFNLFVREWKKTYTRVFIHAQGNESDFTAKTDLEQYKSTRGKIRKICLRKSVFFLELKSNICSVHKSFFNLNIGKVLVHFYI